MSARAWSNVPIGIAVVAGSLLLAAAPVAAQVQGQKLRVEAFIGEVCTVTGASLNFGSVNTVQATQASGSIEITCAVPTNVTIALDGGLKPGPDTNSRFMQGAGPDLGYLLYKNSPGGTPWPRTETVSQQISGSGSVPVHGVIPQQVDGRSGLFTDEVMITLSF